MCRLQYTRSAPCLSFIFARVSGRITLLPPIKQDQFRLKFRGESRQTVVSQPEVGCSDGFRSSRALPARFMVSLSFILISFSDRQNTAQVCPSLRSALDPEILCLRSGKEWIFAARSPAARFLQHVRMMQRRNKQYSHDTPFG